MPETSPIDPRLITACGHRQQRLAAALATEGVDALLISNEVDIRYLTGFIGHDSLLMVMADGCAVISDTRYQEMLESWQQAGICQVVMGTRHRLPARVKDLCTSDGIKRLGIQSEHVTLAAHEQLAAAVGAERLIGTRRLLSAQRMKKDELEIEMIERACRCHQEALAATLPQLQLGMTETQFSAVLEYEMRSRGATGASFTPIIAAGANGSVMHHIPGEAPIEHGSLLVDWGALLDGYCSDMTRTFGIGQMPPRIAEIYPIVLEAQLAAIEACAAGETCASIDGVARKIITDAGYGEHFGHGLGHGLGMEVHEDPYFNNLSTDVELEPGMVMTVEPGIYLPGIGGVRIEDDVVITDGGCRVLSDWPKGLDSAILDSTGCGTSVAREPTS
jgi:Xaa-Pro aminopeptidase